MEARSIVGLRLPYPPSANTYFRHSRGMHFISAAGKTFRTNVLAEVLKRGAGRLEGRLQVEVELCPPRKTCMDVDNALKAILDGLQHAGCYENDGQIDRLAIWRGPKTLGGLALVTIREIPADCPAWAPATLFED